MIYLSVSIFSMKYWASLCLLFFLPAASVQPIHGSYTITNKNRRAGRQEANTIAWEILGALGRMIGEAMG